MKQSDTANNVEVATWRNTIDRMRKVARLRTRTLGDVTSKAKQLEIPCSHLCAIESNTRQRTHAMVSIPLRDDAIEGEARGGATDGTLTAEDPAHRILSLTGPNCLTTCHAGETTALRKVPQEHETGKPPVRSPAIPPWLGVVSPTNFGQRIMTQANPKRGQPRKASKLGTTGWNGQNLYALGRIGTYANTPSGPDLGEFLLIWPSGVWSYWRTCTYDQVQLMRINPNTEYTDPVSASRFLKNFIHPRYDWILGATTTTDSVAAPVGVYIAAKFGPVTFPFPV